MRVLLPPITKVLLISWWVIGLLLFAAGGSFSLAAVSLNNQIFSDLSIGYLLGILVYPFLHDSFLHLLLNSIVFASLGALLESTLTRKLFIKILAVATVAPALIWLSICLLAGSEPSHVVGSSGMAYALLGACLCMFPNMQVSLIIVQLKLYLVAGALIAFSFFATIFQIFGAQWGNSAHSIHLFGALFGWLLVGGHQRFSLSELPFLASLRQRKQRFDADKRRQNSQRVDDILAKVSRSGIGSLSPAERKFLEQQSRKK